MWPLMLGRLWKLAESDGRLLILPQIWRGVTVISPAADQKAERQNRASQKREP
jgi:hypothetical protein